MKTIAVVGAYGKMGRPICEQLRERGFEVKEIDIQNKDSQTLNNVGAVDLVVDFSTRTQSLQVLNYCVKTGTKLIMGTTGQDESFENELKNAATKIPLMKCDNFSENMLKFTNLARTMSNNFDGEIAVVEAHHKHKLDAPSGTAKHLINAMLSQDNNKTTSSSSNDFAPNTITVHSLRGGSLFGRHEIHFFDDDEEIILTHISNSRKPFVNGVLRAVDFLLKKNDAGQYDLADLD